MESFWELQTFIEWRGFDSWIKRKCPYFRWFLNGRKSNLVLYINWFKLSTDKLRIRPPSGTHSKNSNWWLSALWLVCSRFYPCKSRTDLERLSKIEPLLQLQSKCYWSYSVIRIDWKLRPHKAQHSKRVELLHKIKTNSASRIGVLLA